MKKKISPAQKLHNGLSIENDMELMARDKPEEMIQLLESFDMDEHLNEDGNLLSHLFHIAQKALEAEGSRQ